MWQWKREVKLGCHSLGFGVGMSREGGAGIWYRWYKLGLFYRDPFLHSARPATRFKWGGGVWV